MAKETQKEKIERLEKNLNNANIIIQQLNNEIAEMIDKADNSFENSSTYKQMIKQIDNLELKIRAITDTAEHNRKMYNAELKRNSELINDIHNLKNENTKLKYNTSHKLKHNERGAGRKNKFTDSQIKEIKQYRANGKTIKQIADMFGCSVGLIHKLINE